MTSAWPALFYCMKDKFSASFLSPPQVCVDNVLKTMKENANKASSILLTAIPQISQMDWAQTIKTLKVSVRWKRLRKRMFYAFDIFTRVCASHFLARSLLTDALFVKLL